MIILGVVKKKLKVGLGMMNVWGCFIGVVFILELIKNWFCWFDILIVEGYGMVENCVLCSCLEVKDVLFGLVGKVLFGVIIRIYLEFGEILMKVFYLMCGYYKDVEKIVEMI